MLGPPKAEVMSSNLVGCTNNHDEINRISGETALAAVIPEGCVQGVSTRSVDDLVKATG